MFPIFMWVKEYKGLKDFKITFDNSYKIIFNKIEKTLSINKKKLSLDEDIKNFYSIKEEKMIGNIDSINLLIGRNGSGKTSILEVLNLNCLNKKDFYKEIKNINYIIIYKSCIKNNEDFIFEKYDKTGYGLYSIKVEEFIKNKKIKLDSIEHKNYYENSDVGMIKFSFKEKKMNAVEREFIFQRDESTNKSVLYKLNIGLENGSKENIYNYLIEENKQKNNVNFENAYMTILIPDLSKYFLESKKSEEFLMRGSSEEFNNFFRLYDFKGKKLKNIIFDNYLNYLYSYIVFKSLSKNNNRDEILNEISVNKSKLLLSLKNQTYPQKFKILLEKIEEIEDIKFDKKSYEILEKIAFLIDNIPKIRMNTKNTDIIRKYKISCKEKNLEVLELLSEYDSFNIPKLEKYRDLLFKEVEFIKIEEDGLSDGEKIKLDYFSTLYSILNGEFKNRKYITLLFDEVEAFLHPEWSRIFLYELITELEEKYSEKRFKLIFATHSPFLIADVLAKDCIYLEKENGKIEAKIHNSKKTFGANIIDLFKNSMFLESTFGKFATEKIKWVVNKIDNESYTDIKNNSEINYIIEEIGEKLISNKLKSMIEAKLENKDNAKDYYKNKIEEYQAKIREIEKKEGSK
ncbi:AAA family ATPase [Fusobacterium polymorphum]|uniref:AAA family ATPase n=1 Tax=Fusobacterium nucleatum subsp. polymorphum TaxID=76857 RepID=UPI001C6E6A2E|nr:AAA family ATPase [Fusobacterium polymorphum]QYR58350.1 AAA family ATPase [Fusobacterium polymorphum]